MKKFFKVFSVILAILVAAVGGAALGLYLPKLLDEFAGAEAIPYSQFEDFQKNAENTIDGGYEVTIKNVQSSQGSTVTSSVTAKVEALKGAQSDAVPNMMFTYKQTIVGSASGSEKVYDYTNDVIVVNAGGSVMVYFETSEGKFKSTTEDLKQLQQSTGQGGMSSQDMNLQILAVIDLVKNSRKFDVATQIQNKDDAVFNRVVSGDTTKFQVALKPTPSETYESVNKIKLSYNQKQLVGYSQEQTSKTTSQSLKSTINNSTTVKNGFSGTIKVPDNVGEYKEYKPSYANG